MPERVTHAEEVSLNGVRYKLVPNSRIRSTLVSTWVEKQVFGDVTKDSHRQISTQGWSDFSQGMGLERMESRDDKRSWWSTANQRNARHLTLPPLATQTEAFASSRTGNILVSELDGAIVAAVGSYIQSYNGSAWTERHTAAAAPTDFLNLTLTTTEFLVGSYASGYAYADAIATWGTSAKNAFKLAFWDNKLWGIDADGMLWYSYTIGSGESDDAQLPLSHNDAVTGLFTGRDAAGNTILYATTKKFLWAHDFGNRRWIRTSVSLPANLAATGISSQATTWRDDIMLGANTGFLRYRPSATATLEAVLLGHDDGLKKTKEGRVFCMADSIGDLLIGTEVVNSSDSAAIFQWNDMNGFQVLWEAAATNTGIDSLHVSDAITNYRCWFGYGNRVWWVRLHDSVANPRQVSGWTYSDRDTGDTNPIILETPWFNADQEEVTKLLLKVKVETQDCDSNEAVRVRYGTDYSTSWTQFTDTHSSDTTFDATDDRIEGDGITTFTLSSEASPNGLTFRAIRFELALRRGGTTTNTPDVISMWIEFLKVLDDKWGATFEVDMREPYGGRSPAAQRTALLTATESDQLVEFTFRDDTGNSRNFYVNVFYRDDEEEAGHDERGIARVRVEEPS